MSVASMVIFTDLDIHFTHAHKQEMGCQLCSRNDNLCRDQDQLRFRMTEQEMIYIPKIINAEIHIHTIYRMSD